MKYNVAQLLKEPMGSTRSYVVTEAFAGWGSVADRIEGLLTVLKTHQGVLVRLNLDVWFSSLCSRCNGEFPRSSQLFIEEEFFPTTDPQTGHRLSHPDDPDALQIDDHNILDVSEVVRQTVIADQPMKPLCHPDCRGLCQICGTNLNANECRCGDTQIDPRWGALAALLPIESGEQ